MHRRRVVQRHRGCAAPARNTARLDANDAPRAVEERLAVCALRCGRFSRIKKAVVRRRPSLTRDYRIRVLPRRPQGNAVRRPSDAVDSRKNAIGRARKSVSSPTVPTRLSSGYARAHVRTSDRSFRTQAAVIRVETQVRRRRRSRTSTTASSQRTWTESGSPLHVASGRRGMQGRWHWRTGNKRVAAATGEL